MASTTTPVYTQSQIKDLWVRSGGSAMYSDIASAIAIATSGGRPDYVAQQADGTVNRGLWGINSSRGQLSTNDPVTNARGAIELSNNGTDWRSWSAAYDPSGYLGATAPARIFTSGTSPAGQYPTAGNQPASGVAGDSQVNDLLARILDWLGLPDARDMISGYFRGFLYILIGGACVVTGLIVMFITTRQVKNVAAFALETAASGVGFGAGAAVVQGATERGETARERDARMKAARMQAADDFFASRTYKGTAKAPSPPAKELPTPATGRTELPTHTAKPESTSMFGRKTFPSSEYGRKQLGSGGKPRGRRIYWLNDDPNSNPKPKRGATSPLTDRPLFSGGGGRHRAEP